MSTLHEELLISPDISLQAQIQNSQFICELASFKIPAWWGALAGLSAVESKLTYQLRPSNKNTKYLKYLWAFISPNSSLMRSLSESITNCGLQAKSKRDFCVISRKKCFFVTKKTFWLGWSFRERAHFPTAAVRQNAKEGVKPSPPQWKSQPSANLGHFMNKSHPRPKPIHWSSDSKHITIKVVQGRNIQNEKWPRAMSFHDFSNLDWIFLDCFRHYSNLCKSLYW